MSFKTKHDNCQHDGKTLDDVCEPWQAKKTAFHDSISFDPKKPVKEWREIYEKFYTDLCYLTYSTLDVLQRIGSRLLQEDTQVLGDLSNTGVCC
jgi:hypothetical protein